MDNSNLFIIGKYVIDNLTTGMYDNPCCVYREYIQNSADSIDKAVKQQIINKKDAAIFIHIDEAQKKITIEDNGTGISVQQVQKILLDVGNSTKEFGKEKGFRGIGRLGGLSYCEKLVFETSLKGEVQKSIITWNAKELRKKVENRTVQESAAELIINTTVFKIEQEVSDKHYFKVSMLNVTNADLLSKSYIEEYLKMVAPVPFDGSFMFKNEIYAELEKEEIAIDEYRIYLNEDQVYKGYTTLLYDENNGKRTKIGEIQGIHFFKAMDKEEEMLYFGWYSISDVQNKVLPKVNKARGLRLRKNNIQIGEDNRLENFFSETRFNYYVVGEVHAVHFHLVPNGRRDYFEDNETFNEFKTKLKPVCREVQKISHDVSKIRSAQRDIGAFQACQESIAKKQEQGFVDDNEFVKASLELEKKKEKAQYAETVIEKYKESAKQTSKPINKFYANITRDTPKVSDKEAITLSGKPKYMTDDLKLDTAQRKLVNRIYSVITKVLAKELAENLIEKIQEEIKHR